MSGSAVPFRRGGAAGHVRRLTPLGRVANQALQRTEPGGFSGQFPGRRRARSLASHGARWHCSRANALVAANLARRQQPGNDCRVLVAKSEFAGSAPLVDPPAANRPASEPGPFQAAGQRPRRVSRPAPCRFAGRKAAVGRRYHDHGRHGQRRSQRAAPSGREFCRRGGRGTRRGNVVTATGRGRRAPAPFRPCLRRQNDKNSHSSTAQRGPIF